MRGGYLYERLERIKEKRKFVWEACHFQRVVNFCISIFRMKVKNFISQLLGIQLLGGLNKRCKFERESCHFLHGISYTDCKISVRNLFQRLDKFTLERVK